MKHSLLKTILLLSFLTMAAVGFFYLLNSTKEVTLEEPDLSRVEKVEKKAARGEFYYRMLRNPVTNAIPMNARSREIQAARQIPQRTDMDVQFRHKHNGLMDFHNYTWQSSGPGDIAGRTRAMALDISDPTGNTIIAGGVSGGIWKSVDGGDSWEMKNSDFTNLSVTSLAQDPINPDTWYYVTGEFIGNSATDRGFTAPYFGTGVYRSDDNGENWSQIPATSDTDGVFSSPFDFMSRVTVNPTTGSVFIASHGFGILRLNETSQQFELVLGGVGAHLYAEVIANSTGNLIAILSEVDAGGAQDIDPGVYLSTDDGDSWDNITPETFPAVHERSVADFAPSAPDTAYILTQKGPGDESNQGISFHMLDMNQDAEEPSDDRSANIPDFGDPIGFMDTQGGYNMMVAVHPEDPGHVLVGGINLFRSRDGFSTTPPGGYDDGNQSQKDEYWIGGYTNENEVTEYPNQHPDQHEFFFDYNDPDRLWVAHDGGISVTDNITAAPVNWDDRNEGYNTTQFYTAAISDEIGDTRIMGGTQDNGTPYFRFNSQNSQETFSEDVSFGDGGYAYFTPGYLYVARQEGSIIRYQRGENGDPVNPFAYVNPAPAGGQLFVHPYVVDPNDEGIMYYPGTESTGGNWTVWRNTETDEINNSTDSDGAGRNDGWEPLNELSVPSNYVISSLAVSRSPANILFYAGSWSPADPNTTGPAGPPHLYKLNNAHEADNGVEEIPIPGATNGSYIHNIEISPTNADELLVVISNYEVESIFHTTDGGDTWQGVEGNLGENVGLGSSVRSAVIIPGNEGNIYFVGTSTGIYSTTGLNGTDTNWEREAMDEVGYGVVEQLNARYADGSIIAGTHGLGTYLGSFSGEVSLPAIAVNPGEARAGDQVSISASNFQFNSDPEANEVLFGTRTARVLEADPNQLLVEVPRGVIPRESSSNTIQIKVEVNNNSASQTFTVLPPNDFTVNQNFPNPFSQSTAIPFDLPVDGEVTLTIYDINGRKVQEPLLQEEYSAGTYNVPVDFSDIASGIYIYRIYVEAQSGGDAAMESKQMTFIK